MKTYFMPCNLQKWNETKIDYFGVHTAVSPAPYMGKFYLPVFESEEELRKEFPDSKIILVRSETEISNG